MATRKIIDECLLMIALDHSISVAENEFKMRSKMLFDMLSDITDEQLQAATRRILNKGIDLYGKFPTCAVFRENAVGRDLTIEELAEKEVSLIMRAISSYYSELDSANPVTLKTVEDFGGLKSMKWDLDFENEKRRSVEWFRKDILKVWLSNAYNDSKQELLISNKSVIPIVEELANNYIKKGLSS